MGLTVHYDFSFNGGEMQLIDKLKWLSSEFRKLPVAQVHEIGFGRKGYELSVDVAPGCEWFTVALSNEGDDKWSGHSFTKTGLAKDFKGTHMTVIALLDLCKEAGILESVFDESEYWDERDLNVFGKTE